MNATLKLAVPAVLLLAACDEGSLTLSVADAPVDEVRAVVVRFSGVSLIREDGGRESVPLSPAVAVDLLSLSGGAHYELLSARAVATGRYRTVEFQVEGSQDTTESYVDLPDGARLPLYVPSDAQSGLSVPAGVDVEEGKSLAVTVDFDLRSALRENSTATAYELRPKLRLVVDREAGIVSGAVASRLITEGCTPAVYAFSGNNVIADDIDGVGVEPVSSASVRFSTAGGYAYAIGYLDAGRYTLALTCEAAADDPAVNDSILFSATSNVTVEAGRTTTLDFN